MPTYVYRCPACVHTVELVQSMSEKKAPQCSFCGQEMETVLQPTGFALVGSGWAKDGYSKKGPR